MFQFSIQKKESYCQDHFADVIVPHLKQLGLSSIATAVATILMSSASFEGAMVTMWGREAIKVTSKAPTCVAPSAPTMPARSIAKRTVAVE